MIFEQSEIRRVSAQLRIDTMGSNVALQVLTAAIFWVILSSENAMAGNIWFFAILGAAAVRYSINAYFLKPVHILNDNQKFIIFHIGLITTSIMWGLAAFAFYLPNNPPHTALLVVLIIAAVGGGAYNYINDLVSLCCYAVPLLAPLLYMLALTGDSTYHSYIFVIVIFLIVLISCSRKSQQVLFVEQAYRKQVEQGSLLDALTKLPNRSGYHRAMHQLRESMIDSYNYAGLLVLNVDRFKEVNNTVGHQYGDLVLLAFSHRLKDTIPENAVLSRLGGDEFVLLLPALGESDVKAKQQAIIVCEEILADCLKHYEVQDEDFYLEVSIGVAVFDDETGSDADILKYADLALEEAKGSGRNCYIFYDMEMSIMVDNDSWLFRKLREGAKKNNFLPYYQPVYCVETDEIKAAEVLLRWNKSADEVVVAGEFIHLLEGSSLMNEISKKLITTVCAQVASWLEEGIWSTKTRIMFNLCAGDIRDSGFVDTFFSCLHEHGLSAVMFEFEMTEREMFLNTSQFMDQLERLVDAGATLAIDDFGTGYSGLSYLKNMPVSALKIDKSFVDGIIDDEYDRGLISSIVGISRLMKLDTIAEGIENEEQLQLLKIAGCDYYQGYFASRPLDAESFAKKLVS